MKCYWCDHTTNEPSGLSEIRLNDQSVFVVNLVNWIMHLTLKFNWMIEVVLSEIDYMITTIFDWNSIAWWNYFWIKFNEQSILSEIQLNAQSILSKLHPIKWSMSFRIFNKLVWWNYDFCKICLMANAFDWNSIE